MRVQNGLAMSVLNFCKKSNSFPNKNNHKIFKLGRIMFWKSNYYFFSLIWFYIKNLLKFKNNSKKYKKWYSRSGKYREIGEFREREKYNILGIFHCQKEGVILGRFFNIHTNMNSEIHTDNFYQNEPKMHLASPNLVNLIIRCSLEFAYNISVQLQW